MRWTRSYLFTLKETPADAEIPSHILLVRGGYIRKLAPGIFTYGPLMLRSLKKFEIIVREELDKRGCVEILMPMVQPREIWEETGRWKEMGEGLQKLKNRNGHEFCLGATHEEAVTDFARKDVKSYRDLPFNLYQIQTKFRDEIRPRFGLMRGREFIMKDAYSFDRDIQGAQAAYALMHEAYMAIFRRLGVKFRVVQADSGNIGGNQSQEFHILADSGEDQLLVSDGSDFAANIEVCAAVDPSGHPAKEEAMKAVEEFPTPKLRTIEDLSKATGVPSRELVKTMFFSASDEPKQNLNPVAVLLRGSDEVNPVKLKNHFGLANPPMLLTDEEVLRLTGAHPGSCGPVGLKIPVLMDKGVQPLRNFIVGANKDDFHLRNVNAGRDFQTVAVGDFRMAKEGDLSPDGKGHLKSYRGIEVGHIFYLGTKYSKKMQANFLSAEGELKPVEMGCYGIGISRTVQAVIEQNHDKDGIIWPLSIAPYHVHIALLDPDQELPKEVADKIYDELRSNNIECLLDDRAERPGVKFKDADLLGMPLRIVIGAKSLENGEVELVSRRTKKMVKVKALDAVAEILAWIEKERIAELEVSPVNSPIFVALDVDTDKEALRIAELASSYAGGLKVGPRLILRYGAPLLSELAKRSSLFIDNKYFDIPNTMEAAVRASFEMGASFATIHAQAGVEALQRLALVEKELNQRRPFRLLAVTVLTSFQPSTLPGVLKSMPISQMVDELAELAISSGLSGLVCSPEEVAGLRRKFPNAFLLVPGIRMEGSDLGDQKRVADPSTAMRNGASALVVGRPICQADNPAQAAKQYFDAASATGQL